ncbi:hypothetical protein CDAR_254301 [Caerostris darwini]|uniref:Uncharacterized protein n=1 Tax=Caerostris darwini TaxID=1538125 RepID=A0AAV4UB54_9ARAC|nr:hypothetical protein CDAR_254301 [Caerostris darwini]
MLDTKSYSRALVHFDPFELGVQQHTCLLVSGVGCSPAVELHPSGQVRDGESVGGLAIGDPRQFGLPGRCQGVPGGHGGGDTRTQGPTPVMPTSSSSEHGALPATQIVINNYKPAKHYY